MSIREEEQGQRILVGALLIAGAVALVVWKLSAALGVSMEVGAKIISALVAAALLVGVAWWSDTSQAGPSFLSVQNVWPVALGMIWVGLWPALSIWGAVGPTWLPEPETVWWSAWYTKGLVLALIVGGGWWLNWLLSE